MDMAHMKDLLRRLRPVASDRRGVSAIEFALIVPVVMVPLYFGAIEMGFALTAERRVVAVSSALADLVAQAETVSDADLEDILDIGAWIMEPLPTADMSLVITSVVTDEDSDAEVAWSKQRNGTAHAEGGAFALPDGVAGPSSSVIVAEATYNYTIPLLNKPYVFSHTFYSKPRRSSTVEQE
jgi:Flp pilus assembly protein TadG